MYAQAEYLHTPRPSSIAVTRIAPSDAAYTSTDRLPGVGHWRSMEEELDMLFCLHGLAWYLLCVGIHTRGHLNAMIRVIRTPLDIRDYYATISFLDRCPCPACAPAGVSIPQAVQP